MTTQAYRIRLQANQTVDVQLGTAEPISEAIAQIVQQQHLPTRDPDQQQIRYALYNAQRRRLSSESSLEQAGYASGGELYLANALAPWWESELQRRFKHLRYGMPSLSDSLPITPLMLGLAAVITLGALIWGIANMPPPSVAAPSVPPTSTPTVQTTLIPAPTAVPQPAGVATNATPTIAQLRVTPVPQGAPVRGVLPAYRDRDARLFLSRPDMFGAYLWDSPSLSNRIPATSGFIVVSNGDRVQVVQESGGIAQITILSNALDPRDPKVIGATGYLPSWLIYNANIPTAVPRPAAPRVPTATPFVPMETTLPGRDIETPDPRIVMPDLIAWAQADAEAMLQRLGIGYRIQEVTSDDYLVPFGTVAETEPPADTRLEPQQVVTIKIKSRKEREEKPRPPRDPYPRP